MNENKTVKRKIFRKKVMISVYTVKIYLFAIYKILS